MKRGLLWVTAAGVLRASQAACVARAQATAAAPAKQPAAATQSAATRGSVLQAPDATSTLLPRTPGFPPIDPRNFTSPTPSVDTVNSFLHALWGFDENRVWSVAAIQPTQAPGVVAVHVFVSDKQQPSRLAQTTLFITPDGKHAVAGDVVRFGAQPFAEPRALLAKEANGPSRGAADKQLELVEFIDLQCAAACKAAQATLDQLQGQFPQAHIVIEDMPLSRVHPFAYQAAEEGYCVRQAKGDAGYMAYAQSVMGNQAEMTADRIEATLATAARAAGADAAAMSTCAGASTTKAAVDAVVQLGNEVGVNDLPALFVNGRALPGAQVPLATLEKIVIFQGTLDGFTVQQQPTLSTLK